MSVKYGHRPTWEESRKLHTFFFFIESLLEQKMVIIILYTYTVLYIQESSKYFTNYFSYPKGSHSLGKEVSSDTNLVPNGLPFQTQGKWSRVGRGRSCSRSPQLLLALRHPSFHLPTCLCSLEFRVKKMSGCGKQQGQREIRTACRNTMALSRFFKHVEIFKT